MITFGHHIASAGSALLYTAYFKSFLGGVYLRYPLFHKWATCREKGSKFDVRDAEKSESRMTEILDR